MNPIHTIVAAVLLLVLLLAIQPDDQTNSDGFADSYRGYSYGYQYEQTATSADLGYEYDQDLYILSRDRSSYR